MENETKAAAWQGWTLFALRWGLMVAASLAFYSLRRDAQINEIIVPFVIGTAVNLLLAAILFFPAFHKAVPFVAIPGDWVLAGLYTQLALSTNNELFLVAVVSAILVMGMFTAGPIFGVVEAIGTIAIVWFTLGSNANTPFLLFMVAVAVVCAVWSFILDHLIKTQRNDLHGIAATRTKQLSDIRERTKAMYEMASTLSSTLHYSKILDALLDVGRVSLRERGNQRMASAVLLFRASDNALQVTTSRGMRHVDEARVVEGEAGIINDALTQCIPIIGKETSKDPELQYFVAFQGMRSMLCIPLRAGYNNFGVIIYACDSANAFNEERIELLTAISTQATIALQNAVLYRNVLEEKERIVEVEEEARKKLARDLHDGPTQTVSAIAMRMSYIYRLLERQPEQVPAELKKVEELARNTTKEIRHLLFGLRPLVLESRGLAAALQQLAEKMQETYGQAVATRVARDVEPYLDSHQQGTMFYIAEEAVNNARKHAEAELISVTVQRKDEMVFLQISDNGVGFDMSAVDANYDKRGSLGMVNMRERTELLEGSLRIESAEGKGTTITIAFPLKEGASKKAAQKSNTVTTKLDAMMLDKLGNNASQR